MTTIFQMDFDKAFQDHQAAMKEAQRHQRDFSPEGERSFYQAILDMKAARERMYQAESARVRAIKK